MERAKRDLSVSVLLLWKKFSTRKQVQLNLNLLMDVYHQRRRASCRLVLPTCCPYHLSLIHGILFQCKGYLVPHLVPKSIECCHNSNLCNKHLSPMYKTRTTTPDPDSSFGLGENVHYLALLVSVTACLIILIIMVTYVYIQ